MTQQELEKWPIEDLQAALAIIQDKLSGKNLVRFIREKLKTTYDGKEFKITDFYLEWYDLFRKHKRLKIECARDHGKSNIWSYGIPIWMASENNDFHVDIFSYSEDQSSDKLRKIRSKIEMDEKFVWMRPKSSIFSWSDRLLEFPNGSSIGAFGFGSSYRGRHPNLAVIDDPSKDFGSMPIDEQDNFLLSVIEPAVGPRNQIIITGTPVENDDLLERIDSHPAYSSFKYPAIKPDGSPLWPERYTLDDLKQTRMNCKHDWVFEREYMLRRISPDIAMFSRAKIVFDNHYPENLFRVTTVDPAITEGGDFTAIVTTGTDENDKTWVMEGIKMRTSSPSDIVDTIFTVYERWRPDTFAMEAIAFQRILKYWVDNEMAKRGVYFPIEEIKALRDSKETRILKLQPKIASGQMVFCFRAKDVANELMNWNPKSKRNRDDLCDALAMQVDFWRSPQSKELEDAPEGSFDFEIAKLDKLSHNEPVKSLFDDFREAALGR